VGKNRAGTQKNFTKCLFLNEGSGKTKRDRELVKLVSLLEILAFFFVIAEMEIVRRPFLFQAYDPET
jgi:hypothetical protein